MLLPQYEENQNREGCWFCANSKLIEHKAIKEKMPKAWDMYVALENTPNLAYPKWNPYTGETLHQRDHLLTYGYEQLSLFNFIRQPSNKSSDEEKNLVSKKMQGQMLIFDYLKAG